MSTELLEQAKAAFVEGANHFEQGRLSDAEHAFARALSLAPGRPSIQLNLGVTRLRLGRSAEAVPLLEAAVGALPDATDGWTALAQAHYATGQWAAAVKSHARALQLHGNPAAAALSRMYQHYAECLARTGDSQGAVAAYRHALDLDDTLADAWSQLGDVLRETGQLDQAANCYRHALAQGADPALHHYYLAALEPDAVAPGQLPPTPPGHYVQALFDDYAQDFDTHLLQDLGYQGHRLLVEQLPTKTSAPFHNALDLGCGTGLCAPLLRPRAQYLEGVDLSPAMVAKAHERGLYDALEVADIHDHLETRVKAYDLVVAADVFIYVGPLERVMALLAQRMRPGGWLAFTVEDAPDDGADVQLLPSLRYAHSQSYIQRMAQAYGFSVQHMVVAPIRQDQQHTITGRYWYLQRSL